MLYKKAFFFIYILSVLTFGQKLYSQKSDYLEFSVSADREFFSDKDTIRLALNIKIINPYHINSYKVEDPSLINTTVSVNDDNFNFINSFFPESKRLKFEFSENEIDVYEGIITVGVALTAKENIAEGSYKLPVELSFQACDDRVCYSPKTLTDTIIINLNNNKRSESVQNTELFSKIDFNKPTDENSNNQSGSEKLKENERTDSPVSQEDEVSNWIEEKGLFVSLILIFLGGLALNLTPCVYPLIPITVSFFGAQSSGSKSQSILMGVFYALGMSITYSALGVFAALTGSLLGTALQNPIVIIFIALIMLALGLSMFGLFEIKVPQGLAQMGNKNRSGYLGSVLMGLTVGFIAAPCIGPFVLSLLVFVGKTGNPFTGFLLFFILSMGLGLPYIFLAASSSSISKLPRSGEWMEGIKVIFGFILFGMAFNTLEPLIPKEIFKVTFPLYIILSGVYLILFDNKGKTSKVYTNIKYFIAILAVIYGTWNLKPEGAVEEVKWQLHTSLQSIESSINSGNKPVMIDFYADWCAQCKELDEYTYTDPEVAELSKNFNNIKVDLTKENTEISDKFDIKGLPVVIFMNADGEEIKELRVTGFENPEEFKKKINSILK
ncbi:MAG TPA: cytochrome c biogenesis protein CcdA [Ignavibacteria bacterium]|nr:cytochrome c biogenesis protein CcdA [Ignavibacteria bacterium]HQY52665.1 cytochrome c biogenesis protein CcdA [Ignavibacteria bacterium]HRB00732.1 cytochrome c biogenesis protein CcdA [Ignavibacteria bacterium]